MERPRSDSTAPWLIKAEVAKSEVAGSSRSDIPSEDEDRDQGRGF